MGSDVLTVDGVAPVRFVVMESTVFESAVPVVLLAFALTWFLQEIKLRGHDETAVEQVEPAVSI